MHRPIVHLKQTRLRRVGLPDKEASADDALQPEQRFRAFVRGREDAVDIEMRHQILLGYLKALDVNTSASDFAKAW
jgi:hypothetical protein